MNNEREQLAQIYGATRTGRFTAGIALVDDVVVDAAPIVLYMKHGRWDRDRVHQHCVAKGWRIEVVYRRRA